MEEKVLFQILLGLTLAGVMLCIFAIRKFNLVLLIVGGVITIGGALGSGILLEMHIEKLGSLFYMAAIVWVLTIVFIVYLFFLVWKLRE